MRRAFWTTVGAGAVGGVAVVLAREARLLLLVLALAGVLPVWLYLVRAYSALRHHHP